MRVQRSRQSSVYVFLLGLLASGCADIEARRDAATLLASDPTRSLQNPAFLATADDLILTSFQNGYNEGAARVEVWYQGEQHVLLVDDGFVNVNLPGSSWNPLTNSVVFSSTQSGPDQIYAINLGNAERSVLTTDPNRQRYEPSWSPDGTRVVFESHPIDVEGEGRIDVVQLATGTESPLLTPPGLDCRQPNWAPRPDRDRIVFQCMNTTGWGLWLYDDGALSQLDLGEGEQTDASFSPDGEWIVYSGDGPELRSAEIFVARVAGGKPVAITDYDGYDGAPSWSPSGDFIAFESMAAYDPTRHDRAEVFIIAVDLLAPAQ